MQIITRLENNLTLYTTLLEVQGAKLMQFGFVRPLGALFHLRDQKMRRQAIEQYRSKILSSLVL
jgi:hypothetical protein